MACLERAALREFVDGSASEADSGRVELHIRDCDACHRMVVVWRQHLSGTGTEALGMEEVEESAEWVPPDVVGPYRVLGRLGKGGMGVVVRARDERLGRDVALKLLRPDRAAGEMGRLRFLREARALARVSDPGVVAVHEIGRDGDLDYIAMELMAGSLSSRVPEATRPRAKEAERVVAWMLEALDGLAALHDAGLVHRDIKPSNLLLDDDGHAKVGDLGIVLVPDETEVTRGSAPGTPLFCAPEQLLGGDVGPAADVRAAAATFVCLLTGRVPVGGDRDPALKDVPAGLRRILRRALAVDPERRPRDARELAREIRGARGYRHVLVPMGVLAACVGAAVLAAPWALDGLRRPVAVASGLQQPPAVVKLIARDSMSLQGLQAVDAWLSWASSNGLTFDGLSSLPIGEERFTLHGRDLTVRASTEAGSRQAIILTEGDVELARVVMPACPSGQSWSLASTPLDIDGDAMPDTTCACPGYLGLVRWNVESLRLTDGGWSTDLGNPVGQGSPALIDVDGDGGPEILVGDDPPAPSSLHRSARLVALDAGTGDFELGFDLEDREMVQAPPSAGSTRDGGTAAWIDTTSMIDPRWGGRLLRIMEGSSRPEEVRLPPNSHGRFVTPLFIDVDADGTDEVVLGRFDGIVQCVETRGDNRLRWSVDLGEPIVATPVASQQDDDALPEACFGLAHGVACVDLADATSSADRVVWRRQLPLVESTYNGAVELPDLTGDGLPEIVLGTTMGVCAFSRDAPGVMLQMVLDSRRGSAFIAVPCVLPTSEPASARVVDVSTGGIVASWLVTRSTVELEWWTQTLGEPVGNPVTASPLRVSLRDRAGHARNGLVVVSGLAYFLEMGPSWEGPPRLTWSSWAPASSGHGVSTGTPIVVEEGGRTWMIGFREPSSVIRTPIDLVPRDAAGPR